MSNEEGLIDFMRVTALELIDIFDVGLESETSFVDEDTEAGSLIGPGEVEIGERSDM